MRSIVGITVATALAQTRTHANAPPPPLSQLELIGDEAEGERRAARKQQWGNLSDKAREQFYWHQPGAAFSGEPAVPAAGRDADGRVLEPPPDFLLMLLHPRRVHYLRLTDNFAQTDEATEGDWSAVRVNP